MIEIPEGAQFVRQGNERVDIRLRGGDVVEFGDREIGGALVFRRVGVYWVMASVGESGAWEFDRVGVDEVPERVKEMV